MAPTHRSLSASSWPRHGSPRAARSCSCRPLCFIRDGPYTVDQPAGHDFTAPRGQARTTYSADPDNPLQIALDNAVQVGALSLAIKTLIRYSYAAPRHPTTCVQLVHLRFENEAPPSGERGGGRCSHSRFYAPRCDFPLSTESVGCMERFNATIRWMARCNSLQKSNARV